MKLTISKDELLKRLTDIQGIVERKSTMPVLSHFLFDCSQEPPQLYATDLEIALRETVGATASVKGSLAIPAKPFISIIKELDGELSLEMSSNFNLRISSGKITFNLACLNPEEFPGWPEIEPVSEFDLSVEALRSFIEKTAYAASDSDTRYVFNGILLHIQGGYITAVGTDGHRLALCKKPVVSVSPTLTALPEIRVIIPKKAASELRRLIEPVAKVTVDETVSIKIGRNHVLIKTANLEFLTKVIEGTYPNYEQVIPKTSSKKLALERQDFEKALKRVSIISRERSNAVKFSLHDNTLILSASNPDLGSAEEELAVTYEGDSFTIGFNARYILDALEPLESDKVIMEFNDPLGPSLLRAEGDEEYLSVIMPMRI